MSALLWRQERCKTLKSATLISEELCGRERLCMHTTKSLLHVLKPIAVSETKLQTIWSDIEWLIIFLSDLKLYQLVVDNAKILEIVWKWWPSSQLLMVGIAKNARTKQTFDSMTTHRRSSVTSKHYNAGTSERWGLKTSSFVMKIFSDRRWNQKI